MNLLLIALLTGSLWESDSLGEFQAGEFKNVSLTSVPEIKLAPELAQLTETGELLVLGLAADAKGNIFAGTGSEGRVYRAAGKGGELLLSLDAAQVLCLAADKAGNIFAGTSPGGVIYRVNGSKSDTFFNTGQQYVWALTFDDAGALYAGTGDSGLIYKITGKGKGEKLYDSPEPHIMSLTWQDDLYAGSSGQGLVYRIRGKDARVLYETDRKEVKGLVVDPGGVVYAVANPDPDQSSSDRPAVYRIRPDGNGSIFFNSTDSMVFAMVRQGRNLLLGTGSKAHLYSINTDSASADFGVATMLLQSSEGQILALLADGKTGGSAIVGTGNSGKVYRLEPFHAREGSFESRVLDTDAISRWGRCFWTANIPLGTAVAVQTRAGNSEKPDDTWSPWESLRGDIVASKPAHYLQYRVQLSTADRELTPTLSKLTIAYAQTNLPPVVKSVQVKPGEDTGRHQDKVVTWETSDPNNDSLSISIYIIGENEHDWKPVEKDKTGLAKYTLDTNRLPDGWYRLKIVASDKPANPLGLDLTGEKLSARFLVDNTPPQVGDVSVSRVNDSTYRLAFTARDALSLLAKCELSANLKDWRTVAPESGIFDAQQESFSVQTELNKGENVIVIRVLDQAGNFGTVKKVVSVE